MTGFGIVIPSLNQGQFISRTLESVLAQEGPSVQVVVVDGGSSDSTMAVVDTFRRAAPDQVSVIAEPDEGQSDAINKGMAVVEGSVVSWLNADDALLPGALAAVVTAFAEHRGAAAVYGNVIYVDENGHRLYELREQEFDVDDLLWGPCYVPQPATFIARWAWNAAGGVRPDLHYAMDLDLWLRVAGLGTIHRVDRPFAEFRVHNASKSVAGSKASRREAMAIRREHGAGRLGRRPHPGEVECRYLIQRCRRNFAGRRRERKVP
jgi:glycosyltransferase involved in cell wall biosynthesis